MMIFTLVLKLYLLVLELYLLVLEMCLLVMYIYIYIYCPRHRGCSQLVTATLLTQNLRTEYPRLRFQLGLVQEMLHGFN